MSARRPSDSIPAPRPVLEPEWLDIWTAGEPLLSRALRLAPATGELADPVRIEVLLAPWAKAFADGDGDALRRRLSWDGIAIGAAAAALDEAGASIEPSAEEAGLIERYILAARAAADNPERGETSVPFAALWAPWVRVACDDELRADLRAAGIAAPAQAALEHSLLERLSQAGELAAFEMFRRLREGAGGKTGIHDGFCGQVLAGGGWLFYAAFPVLLRQSVGLVLDWRAAVRQFAARLEADRAAIAAAFGAGGAVQAIAVLESDPHHGGQRVLKVEFESGPSPIVYKPRDLAMEFALARFVGWLAEAGCADAPVAPRALTRDGYGWQEWLAAEELVSEETARDFYRRAGAWVAIAHLLRGRDLHAENLVATRRGPAIVDAEMFLQPEELRVGDASAAAPSCLASGLLPDPLRRGAAWRPGMGGLEAPAVHKLGEGARRWEKVGTDAIELSAAPVWSRPLANAAALRGAWLRPEDFAPEIVEGFASTCGFVLAHRDAITAADGPLAAFAHAATRVLFRSSQQYADVLSLLVQPRHQRDGRQAGLLLERLLRPFAAAPSRPLLWPLAADERRALESLDLPRFTIGAGSRELVAESGERIAGVAAKSGLEAVRAAVLALDEREIERQGGILSRALERASVATAPLPADQPFVAEALRIGEWLLRELDAEGASPAPSTPARTGDSGAGVRSGASLLRRVSGVRPDGSATSGQGSDRLGASLASGSSGVALFFAGLFLQTREDRFRAAARRALSDAILPWAGREPSTYPERVGGRKQAESGMWPPSLGGFVGAGGEIWTLVWVARLLGEPEWAERAEELARGLSDSAIAADEALDVHDGVAGLLLGLLTLWEERREAWILERAVVCGERLLATRDASGGWRDGSGLARLGFAHGASGMARALAALARATGDGRFAEAARLGFESERGAFDAERGDWPVLWLDPQSGVVRRSWLTAWCRGAAGAALARGLSAPEGVDPAAVAELATALHTLRQAAPAPVDFLCCGTLGRAAILADLSQRFEQPQLAGAAEELARSTWRRAAERGGWELGPAGEAPAGEWALLKGLSGIGWQLLALDEGSSLPSLLALELPSERDHRLQRRDLMSAAVEDAPAPEPPADGIRIVRLQQAAPPALEAMTFPVYRHLLNLRPGARHPEQGDSRPIQPLAFVAYAGEEPAGLVLAELPLGDARPPEILSVFVAPEFRRRGVAGALVGAAEAEVRSRGFAELDAVYTTGRPGSAVAEHLLERRGWEAPETRTVLVQIVPRDFLASSLLAPERVAALDPGFEYFSWADLDPAERQELIDSDERRPWVTKGLWAWKYDTEGFDRATSLGVRWGGEIVGWVISQRIDATSVRYLASFLRKDLSRRSRILPLYRESLTRGMLDGVELATWVTPMLYPSMIKFILKWMAPHSRLVAETRGRKIRLEKRDQA